MDFKSIEQLTISDCCNQLSVTRGSLKESLAAANYDFPLFAKMVFGGRELTGLNSEIVRRLVVLLREDRACFLQCKTLQQYHDYLSIWNDGLWRKEASVKVKALKEEQEEKDFYLKYRASIEGLERYLHKYPHGIYSQDVRKVLAEKKRGRLVKRLTAIVAAIIVVFSICYMNYHSSSYISSDSNLAFSKKGGTMRCGISTDAIPENIQAYVAEKWIKTTVENGFLNIEVAPNHEGIRNATIHLYAYTTLFGINLWREEFQVRVKEDSGLSTFLTVNGSTYSFDKYGSGEAGCSVETDGMNLNVSSEEDWIVIKKNVIERGDKFIADLVITATVNEGGERTGTIWVKSDNFEKKLLVEQNSGLATRFNVSTNSLVMEEEGTEKGYCYSINIDTDGTTWSVSDAPSWLNTEANVQQGKLQVTLPENTGRIKTGIITLVSNNGDSKVISVKQWGDPTDFSSSSSTVRFGTSSDYEYVNITNDSNKRLFVSDDQDWLDVSVISESRIKISCSRNNDSPRSGSVEVSCGKEELTISIEQDGWEECSNCDGNGQVNCTNYQAQMRYYPFYGSTYHQVYQLTGQYYSFGVCFPQYNWVNCPTCGGDGMIKCSRCNGNGKVRKSY